MMVHSPVPSPAVDRRALSRAEAIAAHFAALPQVTAVALAGSQIAGLRDAHSDLDLYVYAEPEIPLAARAAIARELAAEQPPVEINKPFWGPEDAWTDRASGLGVDLIYWSPRWIEEQVSRSLVAHQASVGYSTCFWYTVLRSQVIWDREGWLARLQEFARQPYPEPLRRAVLRLNHPVLRRISSSYRHQIELAILRRDRISVNHRVAALLASYFDILFAANRLPNPGEKRLLPLAENLCAALPPGMAAQVDALVQSIGSPWEARSTLAALDALLDALDGWLAAQGLLSPQGEVI